MVDEMKETLCRIQSELKNINSKLDDISEKCTKGSYSDTNITENKREVRSITD